MGIIGEIALERLWHAVQDQQDQLILHVLLHVSCGQHIHMQMTEHFENLGVDYLGTGNLHQEQAFVTKLLINSIIPEAYNLYTLSVLQRCLTQNLLEQLERLGKRIFAVF